MPVPAKATKAQLEKIILDTDKQIEKLQKDAEKFKKALEEKKDEGFNGKPVDQSLSDTLQVHVYAAVELTETKDRPSPHTFQIVREGDITRLVQADISKGSKLGTTKMEFKTADLTNGFRLFNDQHYRKAGKDISTGSSTVSARTPAVAPEVHIKGTHELLLKPPKDIKDGLAPATINGVDLVFYNDDLMNLAELLETKLVVQKVN